MKIVNLTIGFVLLTLVFWVIESLWPNIPALRKLERGLGTDLVYWFFTPLVTRAISLLAVLIALVPLLLLLGYRLDHEVFQSAVKDGHGPFLQLPYWFQVVVVLVGGDFIAYWSHRWFH